MKEVATSGYNIGYAAKKHLATYDIVEKAPGWISVITLGFGVFQLVFSSLENHTLAATLVVIGISALYFNAYQEKRMEYERVGFRLTSLFTELRRIYFDVKSSRDSEELERLESEYKEILEESQRVGISKQIFLSDWYAHYKFFWQAQTDWLDEQLKFRLLRDKIPLSLTVTIIILVVAGVQVMIHGHVCGIVGGG
jgi:hypothetical protein